VRTNQEILDCLERAANSNDQTIMRTAALCIRIELLMDMRNILAKIYDKIEGEDHGDSKKD